MLKIFGAGTPVALDGGITAHVYPAGVRHIRELAKQTQLLGTVLSSIPANVGAIGAQEMGDIAGKLLPFLLGEGDEAGGLLKFLGQCVRFEGEGAEGLTLDDIPHHALGAILEAWMKENLDAESRLRPWQAAFTGIKSRFAAIRPTSSPTPSNS